MTKEMRRKAMSRVIVACQQIKDKKPLAEEVRKIVADLFAEERAFKEQARIEHAMNVAAKLGPLAGADQTIADLNEQIRLSEERLAAYRKEVK